MANVPTVVPVPATQITWIPTLFKFLMPSILNGVITAALVIGGLKYLNQTPTPVNPTPPAPTPVDNKAVSIKTEWAVDQGRMLVLKPDRITKGAVLTWLVPPTEQIGDFAPYPDHAIFSTPNAGLYHIGLTASLDGKLSDVTWLNITVGTPPPPVDPNPPKPQPKPPDPTPAPIPDAGLHVLVVYDDASYDKVQKVVTSAAWSAYVKSKANGSDPCWRVFPSDLTFPDGSQSLWKTAMARPRTSLPWLIVSNGTTGFEGPFDPATALSIIQKVGG